LFGGTFDGSVHSVFRQVVNFTDAAGALYCLASEQVDDAPATLRVRLPAGVTLADFGLTAGCPVTGRQQGLFFGGVLGVQAGAVRPWQGRLPAFPGEAAAVRRLADNLAVLRRTVAAYGTGGGLYEFCCGQPAASGDGQISRELTSRAGAMAAALTCGDTAGSLAAGRRLLGLGGGLTPSGDDFLCGLVTVFNMPAFPGGDDYRRLGRSLAGEARTATNLISSSMLAQASVGRARARVIELLTLAGSAAAPAVTAATRQVLDTGAASGTDIAAGLATGLALGLEFTTRQRQEENYGCKGNNKKEYLL
jgi:hypothetical protein